MAITHNLATINDNLSGFNPVAGEVDGTTIGRNYVLWQIFQGFKAFDSNVVMVSSSGDTPDWLKSQSGSIMSAPAKNASTINQKINWFYLNDVGLSGSTPNCFVYEWGTSQDVSSNNSGITVAVRHVISGSTVYYPFTSASIVTNDNGNAGSVLNCMYVLNFGGSTSTTMTDFPNVVFWKSDNASMFMGIGKTDGLHRGSLIWYTPSFTGYRSSLSASFTDGSDFRCALFTNIQRGATWIEPYTQTYETNLATYGSYLNVLSSAGLLPTVTFVISGSTTLLTQKLKFGVVSLPNFKAVSEEIEGIELTNNSAAPYTIGSVSRWNNKYYMAGEYIPFGDATNLHRVYFELGT